MRYQYVVILKKDSERATDVLSVLLCLFSAVSFLRFALNIRYRHSSNGSGNSISFALSPQTWLLCLTAMIIIAGLVVNLIIRRRKGAQVRYRYWLLIAAVGWIGMTPMPWMAAFFFLL